MFSWQVVKCGGESFTTFSLPRPLAVDAILDAGLVSANGGVLDLRDVGEDRDWRTIYCIDPEGQHTHQFLCPGPLIRYFLDKSLIVETRSSGRLEYRYTA
jgi:hypothetical protein